MLPMTKRGLAMKVAILAPLPPPVGGIASWAVRMKNVSLKNGWKIEVIDEKVIGRSIHGDQNKKRISLELKRCLSIWSKLWKTLSDEDVRVVHACTAATTTGMLRDIVSAIISHLRRRKYIIHFRCTIPNLMVSKSKMLVFKVLCNISDTVITLNQQSQKYVHENIRTKAVLIPNFVEDDIVSRGSRRQYRGTLQTVLYTGGITEEKGCAEIVEAARQVPDITFRLVGHIRNEIKQLDIPQNVILTGVQDKSTVQKELDCADAYIFFTHMDSEGFANSLVEAMAAGLPCIVTDWSANADMIEDKGGIVLPIHDVKGMIEAINRLKNNSFLCESYGKWNVSKVERAYCASVVTRQYVDVYEELSGIR